METSKKATPNHYPEQNIDEVIESVIDDIVVGDIHSLMSHRVASILLVSSAYDYFLLEEEGRLSELLAGLYAERGLGYVPCINHVKRGRDALEALSNSNTDLLVIFNSPTDMDPVELAKQAKEEFGIPVVVLANNTPEVENMASQDSGYVDCFFVWQGDGKIFLSIVQYMEDMTNAKHDMKLEGVMCLLLVETRISAYSSYMAIAHEELWNHVERILNEDLTYSQRSVRRRRRPKILLRRDIDSAVEFCKENGDRLLGVLVGSVADQDEGLKRLENSCSSPILTISSRELEDVDVGSSTKILKKTPSLVIQVRDFISSCLGAGPLVFHSEARKVDDLKGLESALKTFDSSVISGALADGCVQRWLISRGEFEISQDIGEALKRVSALADSNEESVRREVLKVLALHRQRVQQGAITRYSRRSGGDSTFGRIGGGALGGKARGLLFMNKILSSYMGRENIKGLQLFIPKTAVIGTDVFDRFLSDNKLLGMSFDDMDDDRIASLFQHGDLSPTILGDMRDFLRDIKGPLIVRSSSLLEDALFQPFAGVYSSVLLPNDSWEMDMRFQDLCGAIKYVFASTFFERARSYLKTTPSRPEDEKMAVIIQEVVGLRHRNLFYPTISGVARSYDYYPASSCKPEDGVASLALGLGKAIVDGGMSYRFCPVHARSGTRGSVEDLLDNSQKYFYAIDLSSMVSMAHRSEDSFVVKRDLETAEEHGVLDMVASTFSQRDERLYPGIGRDGMRVLDFAPLLQMRTIPLADMIRLLLKMGEKALGCPVEIEFAINIKPGDNDTAEMAFLQVRSMVASKNDSVVDINDVPLEKMLCQSDMTLGNGVRRDIRDVVYVKPDGYDLSLNPHIVAQIREMNNSLISAEKKYLLIGPGRWGSSDPWLGIPVVWSDIAGAGMVVETPVKERIIDPSQGSHFFQNMISARVCYMTLRPGEQWRVDWDWLEKQPVVHETESVRHILLDKPLEILMDGRTGRGIILKTKEDD